MGWHILRVMGDLLCVLILLAALGAVARVDQHVHALKLAHNEPAHPVFGAPAQGQESVANFAFMPEPLPPGPTQVDVTVNEAQRAQYDAVATKTALELQQFRRQETIPAQGWGGTIATATGLIFFGEENGAMMAADATTGKPLWSFETNQNWKASPMAYQFDGKQFIAAIAGGNVLAFGLPD